MKTQLLEQFLSVRVPAKSVKDNNASRTNESILKQRFCFCILWGNKPFRHYLFGQKYTETYDIEMFMFMCYVYPITPFCWKLVDCKLQDLFTTASQGSLLM